MRLIDESAPSASSLSTTQAHICIWLADSRESTSWRQSTKAENKRLQTELQSLKNSLNDPTTKSDPSQAPAAGKEQRLQERKIQDLGTLRHACGAVPAPSAEGPSAN